MKANLHEKLFERFEQTLAEGLEFIAEGDSDI
jgi:hypothetical protein